MIAFYITLFIGTVASTSTSKVSTNLGDVRGSLLKSRLGKEFHAFHGIPYGKPPIGDLRFRNPEPVTSWKPDVVDGTIESPGCPDVQYGSVTQQEDCLHLNIFSSNLSVNALKPVVVFIHGGAFVHKREETEPTLLMDREIVFVTFNYRLGFLGFLATGTVDAPGNAGFKDQVLALKWIKEHIQNFGGDPKAVTLFGYDTGGLSVGLHLVSPMSRGLFHNAIAMSSTLFGCRKTTTGQPDLAMKLSESLNCPTNTTDAMMMKCLKETPVEEIADKYYSLSGTQMFTFFPVIEADFGQERFITEDPISSLQAGRFQKVPLIIGMVKFPLNTTFGIIQQSPNKYFSKNLISENFEKGGEVFEEYKKNLKDIVGHDYNPKDEGIYKLIMADGSIGFPVHRFAHLTARYVPVYYYRFSLKEPQLHDDLKYLIPLTANKLFPKEEIDGKIVERVTRMWTQFAKTGNPNNSTDEYLKNLKWTPLDLKMENFLDIGEESVMMEDLYLKRFNIWEKIIPLDWTGQNLQDSKETENYPAPKKD